MMESTVMSLFSDYKHGKRFKSQPHTSADITKNNTRTMPSLPRSKPRKSHPSVDSFHRVEVSQRLRCTTTPPPSLQSQSLPRISLHGNPTRQQHHHSNSYSNHLPEKIDNTLFMPSIQYRTTQSLPSLSQSKLSGKSSTKSIYTKDPQKRSTFDLFKTSRLGLRTASHRQNFAWDFSPRDDEVSTEMNDTCFPTLGHGDTQSTRPVHLYMSVEMMDKLLEKRKGLRSDATLNALIGLPPSTKKNSNIKTRKEPPKDSPSVKAVRMKVDKSNVQEVRPSILKETTSKESTSEEPKSEEPKSQEPKSQEPKSQEPKSQEPKSQEPKSQEPKSQEPKSQEPSSEEPKSQEPKSDKDVDNNTSKGKTTSEDLQEDEMACEFEDEEEEELGELEEEDGDGEFDAAEDEEEDADDEEEEFEQVSNDSDDEDFSGQGREGDELPDTAEDMEGDCDDEEEEVGEELDKQDSDNSDDDADIDLAGQDEDRGSDEEEEDAEGEEGESDQDDEPVENDDEEEGELSDEDGQTEASEDDAELISDDDGDE